MKNQKNSNQGVTLIEIVITIVWFSICIVPMIYTYSELISLQSRLFHKYQALSLSQKNIEIVTNISQADWTKIKSFATDTPLFVEQDPITGYWDIKSGIYKESIYETHFQFSIVCRNAGFEIVDCADPTTVAQDTNSLQITSTTTWKTRNINQKIELSTNLNKIL